MNQEHTIIIAEAGVNHNGDLGLAKELVAVAAAAGADYVKFQTFKTELLVSRKAEKAAYQIQNTGSVDTSQFEMIKKLELDMDSHLVLMDHAQSLGIKFLSTAFDLNSIDLLVQLGIELFKIPSGEITNLPYLQELGSMGRPLIMSTGMAKLGEIEAALEVLMDSGAQRSDIIVLHCNTEYPTPIQDVNLSAMCSIAEAFKVKVGYSDHTLGIEIPIAAVALGAVCIEKHFTLDKNMEGPDHKASLEPEELMTMVSGIRKIEKALGNGVKEPSPSEKKNIAVARKSIHLSRNLDKGESITDSDLQMLRPGDGISPMELPRIIGRKLNKHLGTGTKLSYSDLA